MIPGNNSARRTDLAVRGEKDSIRGPKIALRVARATEGTRTCSTYNLLTKVESTKVLSYLRTYFRTFESTKVRR